MLTTVFRQVKSLQPLLVPVRLSSGSFFDPPYLPNLQPKVPIYDTLNVQLKGYDYALLENAQKEVHRIARAMKLDVSDAWATPATQCKILKYKMNSTIVDNEYSLKTYERNVQVVDLPTTVAPIFFEFVQAVLPPGVSMSVHEHTEEHETIRIVPDFELNQLKTQLDELGGPLKKKKHK